MLHIKEMIRQEIELGRQVVGRMGDEHQPMLETVFDRLSILFHDALKLQSTPATHPIMFIPVPLTAVSLIGDLGLSQRAEFLLKSGDIHTVGDLVCKKESELLTIPDLYMHLHEVKTVLAKHQLTLEGTSVMEQVHAGVVSNEGITQRLDKVGSVPRPPGANMAGVATSASLADPELDRNRGVAITFGLDPLEEIKHSRVIAPMLGKTFGKLRVFGETGRKHESGGVSWMARCRCKCGNVCSFQPSKIRSGDVTDCGYCSDLSVAEIAALRAAEKVPTAGTKPDVAPANVSVITTPEYQAHQNATTPAKLAKLRETVRGKLVEAEWKGSLSNFIQDVGYKPDAKAMFVRINRKKGWLRGNVGWRVEKKIVPGLKVRKDLSAKVIAKGRQTGKTALQTAPSR